MIEIIEHNRPWANPFDPEQTGTPAAVQKAIDEFGFINLHLGLGEKQGNAWINVDIRPLDGVQVVHDLENTPWPFPDSCADIIVAPLIIEHINPAKLGIIKFFNECWRVLKPEHQFMVSVPYGGSPMDFGDPSHCVSFGPQTFLHFDPLHPSSNYDIYRPLPWKLNHINFQVEGIIECVLAKRLVDPSYKCEYAVQE